MGTETDLTSFHLSLLVTFVVCVHTPSCNTTLHFTDCVSFSQLVQLVDIYTKHIALGYILSSAVVRIVGPNCQEAENLRKTSSFRLFYNCTGKLCLLKPERFIGYTLKLM